jgi:hypothetical protein
MREARVRWRGQERGTGECGREGERWRDGKKVREERQALAAPRIREREKRLGSAQAPHLQSCEPAILAPAGARGQVAEGRHIPHLPHSKEEGITIAVHPDGFEQLVVAAGVSLAPQPSSAREGAHRWGAERGREKEREREGVRGHSHRERERARGRGSAPCRLTWSESSTLLCQSAQPQPETPWRSTPGPEPCRTHQPPQW